MLRPDAFQGVVELVVATLAAWRVTTMLCYERGPFECFTRLRRVAVSVGMAGVVTCFHCALVWVSAGVALAIYGIDWETIPLLLAVAGGGSIIERALGGTQPGD